MDIDECATNPCANGGLCQDRPNGYQCNCMIGYYGPNCQSTSPECRPEYCSSSGQCLMKGNQVSCVCNPGYTGYRCETKMDICDSNPCRNGGVCIGTGFGSFKCRCPFTHSGSHCEHLHDTLAILSQGPWRDCPNAMHCHERFGNKICDPECNSPQCFYDGFDCRSAGRGGSGGNGGGGNGGGSGQFTGTCLPEYDTYCALNYGNGHCDQGCNNTVCGWDGMDCILEVAKEKEVMIVLVVENLSIDKLNSSASNSHPKKATELLRQLSISTGNVFSLDEMKSTETGTVLVTKMDTSKCPEGEGACIENAEDFKRWMRFNQYTASRMEQYLLENAMSLKVDTDKARVDPTSPVPGAQNFTYIILGLFTLLFIGILLGVLYSNSPVKGKKMRAATWFPEGFASIYGSGRSRTHDANGNGNGNGSGNHGHNHNSRHSSSVANAAGGNFRRNNRLNGLELGGGLKHSTSIRYQADGQEMRQFKSQENLFNDEKNGHGGGHCLAREGIYEEPYENRHWTNEHYNAIQHDVLTPPLPTTASLVDVPGPHGQTPMMAVIMNMPLSTYDNPDATTENKAITDLLSSGANPSLVCDKTSESSLHLAARYVRVDAAKSLLDSFPDLCHARDANGRTPLHTAIASDARGVFEILLRSRKTDFNAQTHDGTTPLILAARMNSEGMVEELVKAGAELNMVDESGRTALHWAVSVDNVRAAEVLLANGADRDAKNGKEETPLFLAAREGAYKCAKLLLDFHANRDITDHMDRLPRDISIELHHTDITDLLDRHEPPAMMAQVISPGSCGSSSMMSPNSVHNGGWAMTTTAAASGTLGRGTLGRRKAAQAQAIHHQHQSSTLSTATESTLLLSSMSGTLKKGSSASSSSSPPQTASLMSPVGGNAGPPPLPPPRNATNGNNTASNNNNNNNNNTSAVTPYSTACQPMQLQQLLSPNTPQPILMLGAGAPDGDGGAAVMMQAANTQLSLQHHNSGYGTNSLAAYPPPMYGHTTLMQQQQQQPQPQQHQLNHQQQQQQMAVLPQTPVQLTEFHHLSGHSPYSFDFSPPNSMLTASSAMISPPSRPPPPYEDVCYKQTQQQQQQMQHQQTQQQQQQQHQQQLQPIAVAPRHMNLGNGSGQPPTPTATTAPNLGGPNGQMMRWPVTGASASVAATATVCGQTMIVTGAQQPNIGSGQSAQQPVQLMLQPQQAAAHQHQHQHQQQQQQQQRPPDSYPTPSPDSWGSLSTSSPLSAHDWSVGGAMGDSGAGHLAVAGAQMGVNNNGGGGNGGHNMILSPQSAQTLSAAQSNPRFQPTSTQQAVFI